MTWRAREGAQTVVARDVVALIQQVIRVQLELYITHLIVERGVEEDVARVADDVGTAADLPETLTHTMHTEADTEPFDRALRDDELRPDVCRMAGRTRALQVEVLRPIGSLSDLSDIVAVAGHHAPVG